MRTKPNKDEEEFTDFKRADMGNGKCIKCSAGLAHDGAIEFYRITVERFFFNDKGIREIGNLENFFGGGTKGATLADAMGTDPNIADGLGPMKLLICEKCISDHFEQIPLMMERKNDE